LRFSGSHCVSGLLRLSAEYSFVEASEYLPARDVVAFAHEKLRDASAGRRANVALDVAAHLSRHSDGLNHNARNRMHDFDRNRAGTPRQNDRDKCRRQEQPHWAHPFRARPSLDR